MIAETSPTGFLGRNFYEVRLRCIEGDYDAALEALESAYENGVTSLWRFHRDFDVALRPLRDHPGYAEVAARLDAGIEKRREAIADLRGRGVDLEPPAIP